MRDAAPRIFPTFRYRDALAMHDWLVETVGFRSIEKSMANGRLAHAELAYGASMIMIGEVRDDFFGGLVGGPGEQGGKSTYVAVQEPDALCERIRKSGGAILQEPVDRPYGSREFICTDPEGNVWCFGTYLPKA